MPDLPNRDELEAMFARKLSKANREVLNLIIDQIGDNPKDLSEEDWIRIRQLLEAGTIGALETIYIAATENMMDGVGIGVDWTLINERAAQWATRYGFDMVRDMTTRRRRFLQSSIRQFYDTGMTIGDLKERLSREFGVVRAEAIAVTETTRAASEGQRQYIDELTRQGVKFERYITTNEDDRVCVICAPKNGKDPEEVGYPPFHVKCRCGWQANAVPLGATA
jgi:hypothetical protein